MKKFSVILIILLFGSCKIENINYFEPIITTDEPKRVLTNSALLGGSALAEGGKDITEFGIVWSKNFPPTIDDNKNIEGERLGSFSKLYSDFESNTTYYYCAYGLNEVGVGYGEIYTFTTSAEPICSPQLENYLDLGSSDLQVDDVTNEEPSGFNEGNIEFTAFGSNSSARVILQFNEIDSALPLTGLYNTVRSFDNQSVKSNGELKLKILDFGIGSQGGGSATVGERVYIRNENDKITFIFCDIPVGNNYILNGKFTYE